MPGILSLVGRTQSSGGSSLQVTVSPAFVTGFSNFGIPTTVRTRLPARASVSGGTPPYNLVWSFDSGDETIYPNSLITSAPYFSAYLDDYETRTATWICTATDAAAATADSNPVTVTLSAYDLYKPEGPDIVP